MTVKRSMLIFTALHFGVSVCTQGDLYVFPRKKGVPETPLPSKSWSQSESLSQDRKGSKRTRDNQRIFRQEPEVPKELQTSSQKRQRTGVEVVLVVK